MPSMVGILGRAPAIDKKVWCFLVCLSVFFVTLWNDEVCDNGNAMKQYNFQNNYGAISQRKVCSCAPMFKFSYRPPEFFQRGKFFIKNYHFWRFLVPYGHSFKATTLKLRTTVRSWVSLPQAKYCKNRLSWYTPLEQIYNKNTIFGNFLGLKPTFNKPKQ